MIILLPGCKFLVGGHKWTCDIVREEVSLGGNMQKLNHVVVADESTTARVWKRRRGNDLPVIVDILMSVCGNLLSCERLYIILLKSKTTMTVSTLATDTTVIVSQWVRIRMRV